MAGFVKQDPLNETESPENPIRKFIMGPQLFAIIKASLLDPDMENSPVHYINGTDFIVTKTSKGGYADYGTSKWARKESSISEEMMEAINKYGLVDLSTYLPKKPTPEQLATIYDMFQASLEGELYDPEKWAKDYKPYGFDSAVADDDSDGGEGKRVVRAAPQKIVTPVKQQSVNTDPPFDPDPAPIKKDEEVSTTDTTPASGKSPQEILEMLRNRNKK